MRDPQELSVGKFLQQERERKKVTLEAVSQATRISVKNLEAIENDDFAFLPAPIFIRSFLKVYASYIGLNPDKAIALYETQTGVIGLPPSKGLQPEKTAPRRLWLVVLPVLLIAIIGVGIYWLVSPRETPPIVSVSPPPPPPAPVPEPPKVPAPPPETPPVKETPKEPEKTAKPEPEKKPEAKVPPGPPKILTPPPSPPLAAPSSGPPVEEKKERRHILRVQAKEQTWVRVQADDQPEFEVLLEPQEKAVWTARRQLKITLGNAAGLDMAFNGKMVGPFGGRGQVVHLQFPLPEGKKPGE